MTTRRSLREWTAAQRKQGRALSDFTNALNVADRAAGSLAALSHLIAEGSFSNDEGEAERLATACGAAFEIIALVTAPEKSDRDALLYALEYLGVIPEGSS